MHQDHNIPWSIFCTHFRARTYECERCRFHNLHHNPWHKCPTTILEPRGLPTQTGQLVHWARRLTRTIHTFAETERAKFPTDLTCPTDVRLLDASFPEQYEAQYSDLDDEGYCYRYWIARGAALARKPIDQWAEDLEAWSLWDRHLAISNLVKILLDADKPLELLRLARSGRIGGDVYSYGQSHQMGWKAVVEAALQAYIVLNVIGAMSELQASREKRLRWAYECLFAYCVLNTKDYNCQALPHWKVWLTFAGQDMKKFWVGEWDPFAHMALVREYLKKCFRLMYLCDMVAREAGFEIGWEQLVVWQLRDGFQVKLEAQDLLEALYVYRSDFYKHNFRLCGQRIL